MKTTIIFLVSLLMAQMAWSNPQNQLPEEPWRAIVEIIKYNPAIVWEKNISIKLFGNYSQADSAFIENSVKILNELCETIELKISTFDRGNMEIYFLDSTNENAYQDIIDHPKDISSVNSQIFDYQEIKNTWSYKSIIHYNLSFRLELVPKEYRQNFMTNHIAFALFSSYWSNLDEYKNGEYVGPITIFKSRSPSETLHYRYELNKFDREILKTVYSQSFSTLFPEAKKLYGKHENPEWLRKNSHEMLVFPLVLILFLLIGLFILIYKKFIAKIENKLLRFNVISVLALLIFALTFSLFDLISLTIKHPYAGLLNFINIYRWVLFFLILGLPCVNIIRLIETAIHRKTQHKYLKFLLLFLSTSLIPFAAVILLIYLINKAHLSDDEFSVLISIFLVFVVIGIIRSLISFFILKEKEVKIENEVKLANMRELKTKAELNALHSKINPHFLYNALNSIAGLAKTNADKTEQMALSLSKLFRHSINKEQSDWSTYAEEIEMVTIYLDIEKVRFDDRLEFSVELPEALKAVKVPRFIIQPLVENAIKHGISKVVSQAKISIAVKQIGESIEISVADNGPDFPAELIPGFGLQSIFDKLEIMYPNRFEIHYLNAPNKHILIKLS